MPVTYRRQQGMTMASVVIILALIAFFTNVVIRVMPMYIEKFKVVSHLEGLVNESDITKMTAAEIKNKLMKRFFLDDVKHIKKEDISVTKDEKGQKRVISVSYEVRAPFWGEIEVVGNFKDLSVEVPLH